MSALEPDSISRVPDSGQFRSVICLELESHMYPKSMNYHGALSRVVALVCVGMGMSLQAGPEKMLTLRSALARVEQQNPELVAMSCEVLSAEGTVRQAGAWANPTLGVDAEEFGGTGAREGYESAQTTVRLTQPVDLGGSSRGWLSRWKGSSRVTSS
jgi:hypothetical protein